MWRSRNAIPRAARGAGFDYGPVEIKNRERASVGGAFGLDLTGFLALALDLQFERVAIQFAAVLHRDFVAVALAGHCKGDLAVFDGRVFDLRLLVVATEHGPAQL